MIHEKYYKLVEAATDRLEKPRNVDEEEEEAELE